MTKTPLVDPVTEASQLAAEILAGKYDDIGGPYGRNGIYSAQEWKQCAQYLVDSDDCDEMVYMIAQEEETHDGADGWCQNHWADEADYRADIARDAAMLDEWEQAL